MNKSTVVAGLVVLVVGFGLFYETFTGGLAILSTILQQTIFLLGIIALPIGMAIASYGFAAKAQAMSGGGGMSRPARSGMVWVAVAVGVIGIILGGVGIALASSTSSTVSTQLSTLPFVNVTPAPATSPRTFRIDWTNTDPTGQDRFNLGTIIVNQGDSVFIWFEQNDTDAHTFTLVGQYGFQINATIAPEIALTGVASSTCSTGQNVKGCLYARNFLTNANFTAGCVNGAASTATSTGCVTGNSSLSPSTLTSSIPFNPTPAIPLSGASPLVGLKNDNKVIGTLNASDTTKPAVQGDGGFVANRPGIYEYFCFYHVSNGMFGYLIVLPNKAYTGSAIIPTYFPFYIPVENIYP